MPALPSITADDLQRARLRLLRMHFESGVGHIGGNLSCIDVLVLLMHEYVGQSDRFVLSKGHGAGALYVALWSIGALQDAQLSQFHCDDTLLPGHPPATGFHRIPFSTGSLGHGFSLAAGLALAFRFKNTPGRVYCLTSDGEWQEGSTWEALIFACHHKLHNLTILVDHNRLQGFGDTASIASMAPLWERLSGFEADICVVDGHDLDAMRNALDAPSDRLRIIFLTTIKGRGVSFMENRFEWHYLPLTTELYSRAKTELGSHED